jgi:hypothetical protein
LRIDDVPVPCVIAVAGRRVVEMVVADVVVPHPDPDARVGSGIASAPDVPPAGFGRRVVQVFCFWLLAVDQCLSCGCLCLKLVSLFKLFLTAC